AARKGCRFCVYVGNADPLKSQERIYCFRFFFLRRSTFLQWRNVMSKKLPSASQNAYLQRLANGEITRDILLKERDMMLDLYKHHLKLLLEANIFIYAVTGALASFVITHTGIPHIRWVLLLPGIV